MAPGDLTLPTIPEGGSIVGKPVVAAVFATMNRKEVATSCVRALGLQTLPPKFVIVADNVSLDGTPETLEGLTALPFELIVHRMSENRGNAGGVEEVMKLAFDRGVDAVWILDDDSWPRPDALDALLAKTWDPRVVRHPLQIDPRTNRFTWPLQVADGSGGWKLVNTPEELPPGDFIRSRIIWTGALVPREVRDVTGPVNGDLFIRGEDEEYPWRFEQAGFTQEASRHAVLDHPGPEKIVHWQIFGKHFFYEPDLVNWKLYYKVRNMVWLKRKQSGGFSSMKMAVTYLIAAILIDGPGRVFLVWKAVKDGWMGRLGKLAD